MTNSDHVEASPVSDEPAVEVRDLSIQYTRMGQTKEAVKSVSFQVMPGEVFGIVGESGSGKSTVAYSLMRYLASNAEITNGEIFVGGKSLMAMNTRELRAFRGQKAAMVYQDATSALNPAIRVGKQIAEVFHLHSNSGSGSIKESVKNALREVQFVDPENVAKRYPHQLSGGQQQRICIAMALASDPGLLILDEPTTGLDLTVQGQVLKLLYQLHSQRNVAMLYISHDLATVKHFCSRVGIMRDGVMVEQNDVHEIFDNPQHPYTEALIDCIPTARAHKSTVRLRSISETIIDGKYFSDSADLALIPTLELDDSVDAQVLIADDLHKKFSDVTAAEAVSLAVRPGEILGIVGESGSGKSTLARLISGLTVPDSGIVKFKGEEVAKNISNRSLAVRRGIQMVFQRPDTTLNPVLTIRSTLQRSVDRLKGVRTPPELMREVMLDQIYLDATPKRLSGGMKQRVAIARALAGDAEVLICDEATSALDPSIQAAILNQIVDLAATRGTAVIFISHDLDAVRYVSDRIMVVYRGHVVETGPINSVLDNPQHEYTKLLIGSTVDQIKWDDPLPKVS